MATRNPTGAGASLTLLLMLAPLLCAAGDFLTDIVDLANQADAAEQFTEDNVGFDLHKDIFYYQDKLVSEQYKRNKYLAARVVLGGQQPDLFERTVKPAVNPFAVGQRSLHSLGTSSDRWDVKDNGRDVQLFGLFHGTGSDFVVNKVRAHLLRHLGNSVYDHVRLLERSAQPDAGEHADAVARIQDELRAEILKVFREIDETIANSMKDSDDSAASATVAIVTRSHVVTANVGAGKVLAHDNHFNVHNLTPGLVAAHASNLFGAKKSRRGAPLEVQIDVYQRELSYASLRAAAAAEKAEGGEAGAAAAAADDDDDDDDDLQDGQKLQLLVLETPSVGELVADYDAVKMVLSSVEQHRANRNQEQDLFKDAVDRILETVASRLNFFQKIKNADHSVILVTLDTDYESVHW